MPSAVPCRPVSNLGCSIVVNRDLGLLLNQPVAEKLGTGLRWSL
jgi:hypothetical protein